MNIGNTSIKPIFSKWKSTLSDRKRFYNQMHYLPIDRSFNIEFGYWKECYERWSLFKDNGIKNEDEANNFFNFDRICYVGGNVWMSPPFKEEIIETTPTTHIIRNADGLIAEVPIDRHSTIPHFTKSSINSPEDWEKIKKERFRLDDSARKVDIEKIKKKHSEDRDYPLGVNCGSLIGKIRDMLTFEGLIYACYDYPLMVEDMVETACQLVEHFLDQVLPHIRFDFASGWEDICFKNGPIVSLEFFKKVLVPRYKRIGERLHSAGIDIWYIDCDGDIRPIIPYFLEAGVNCMFPFEVNSSGHPSEVLRKYGKDLKIMGGVDKMQLIKGKKAIKEYLESIAVWVERGGFIPFCDHRCPPDVTEENYLYYLKLKKEMFGGELD